AFESGAGPRAGAWGSARGPENARNVFQASNSSRSDPSPRPKPSLVAAIAHLVARVALFRARRVTTRPPQVGARLHKKRPPGWLTRPRQRHENKRSFSRL